MKYADQIVPNAAQFLVWILGEPYHVDSVTGRERISAPFEYQILCRPAIEVDSGFSSKWLDPARPDLPTALPELAAIVGTVGSLEVRMWDTGTAHGARRIHGMYRDVSQVIGQRGQRQVKLVLVPRMWILSRTVQNRVFREMRATEIAMEIFEHYQIQCRSEVDSEDAAEITIQYGESDLAFVSRLLEREGISYYFDQSGDQDAIVMTDTQSGFDRKDPREHRIKPDMGQAVHDSMLSTLFSATWSERVETSEVTPCDYDYWSVSTRSATSKAAKGEGSSRIFGYEFQEADEGREVGGEKKSEVLQRRSDRRLQELRSEVSTLTASGTTRQLFAGAMFQLEESEPPEKAGEYLVVETWMDFAGTDYLCGVRAVPAADSYRPPRITPRPVITGVQTARVVGGDDDTPVTDRLGRVKIRFHWDGVDTHSRGDEDNTIWVRVAWSHAGSSYGIQFIPRVGMEVVVSFLNGDPDRPLVTGLVYNQANPPPLAEEDRHYQNVIRTQKGSQLWYEDMDGKEEVKLHTPEEKNSLFLYGGSEDHKVTLKTDEGHLEFSCALNDTTTVGKDMSTEVGANQTLDVAADRTVTVGGNKKVSVTGNTTIQGTGAGTITIKQGGGTIKIDPAGNIEMKGLMIKIQGTMVEIQGAMVKIN